MTDQMSLAEKSDAVLRGTGMSVMPPMDATIRDALESGYAEKRRLVALPAFSSLSLGAGFSRRMLQ